MIKTKTKINKDFFNQLENELNDLKSDIGNYVAGESSRRLSNAAHDAIEGFYDDYDPVQYKRHGYFYDYAYRPYRNSNTATGMYYGGIRLTPELFPTMPDPKNNNKQKGPYNEDTYLVYGLVMGCIIHPNDSDDPVNYDGVEALGGYHGPYSYLQGDPPPFRPDPITRILKELDNIYTDGNKMIDDAVLKSKMKRNYKLLQF